MYHHAIKQDGIPWISIEAPTSRASFAASASRRPHGVAKNVFLQPWYHTWYHMMSRTPCVVCLGKFSRYCLFNRCLFTQRVFCRQTLRAYVGEPWLQETEAPSFSIFERHFILFSFMHCTCGLQEVYILEADKS